ncbi:MAG: toll/interleukin-1 receptor domain-containing protein [Planctomycetaceae bacterium]
MPPHLRPETLRRLVELLASAFDRHELEQIVQFDLGETLANVVATDVRFSQLALETTQWAGRQGRLLELAEALARARPGRTDLQEAVRQLRSELTAPPPASSPALPATPGIAPHPVNAPGALTNPGRLPTGHVEPATDTAITGHKVFLSYSTASRATVVRVAEWLEGQGIKTWFDQWDLVPGDRAQVEMTRALQQVPVVVICLGPTGLGPWQTEEMEAAIGRRVGHSPPLRIIPLLLPGTDSTPDTVPLFLRGTTWVRWQTEAEFEPAMEQLKRGIERRRGR